MFSTTKGAFVVKFPTRFTREEEEENLPFLKALADLPGTVLLLGLALLTAPADAAERAPFPLCETGTRYIELWDLVRTPERAAVPAAIPGTVDVVVTDGFTGNVVLKTLEGGMRTLVSAIFEAFGSTPETQAASEVLVPALLPLYATLDPDNTGGAMLLGVDGLCLISHGSSSATAVVSAVRVAKELHEVRVVPGTAEVFERDSRSLNEPEVAICSPALTPL